MWVLFLSLLLTQSSDSCSSFASPDAPHFMAKSYDWDYSYGMVVVNKRNVKKKAIIGSPKAEWTSKYGSVTFNQHGREFPISGMNEKGLAIEILWLASSQFPSRDGRPELNEVQWIQYHLDQAKNVREMIQLAKKVRIKKIFANVHYFACDKSGACATFEYIDGRLKVHSGDRLKYKVLTNSTYASSLRSLKKYREFGGSSRLPESGYGSRLRFARLAKYNSGFQDITTSDERFKYSFDLLKNVRKGGYSKWNIVYNLSEGTIRFKRLDLSNSRYNTIDTTRFDYSCLSKVQVFDMDKMLNRNITSDFQEADGKLHARIVRQAGKDLGVPQRLITGVVMYPWRTKCME